MNYKYAAFVEEHTNSCAAARLRQRQNHHQQPSTDPYNYTHRNFCVVFGVRCARASVRLCVCVMDGWMRRACVDASRRRWNRWKPLTGITDHARVATSSAGSHQQFSCAALNETPCHQKPTSTRTNVPLCERARVLPRLRASAHTLIYIRTHTHTHSKLTRRGFSVCLLCARVSAKWVGWVLLGACACRIRVRAHTCCVVFHVCVRVCNNDVTWAACCCGRFRWCCCCCCGPACLSTCGIQMT